MAGIGKMKKCTVNSEIIFWCNNKYETKTLIIQNIKDTEGKI